MDHMISLLAQYGLLFVFGNVLLTQAGLPLPALPTLIVAGALVHDGQLSLALVLLMANIALHWIEHRYFEDPSSRE